MGPLERGYMNKTPRVVAIAATLSVLLSALGCATPQGSTESLSASQRTAIRSVSIAKSIAAPDYPQVVGPSASTVGFFLGPLGLAASALSENPDSQALQKVFSEHGIDIKDIVRQEFAAELSGRQAFDEIADEGGDAVFELTVEGYGLGPAFSMRPINAPLSPTLRLAAKLSDRSGVVLWQNTAFNTALNGTIEARRFEDALADPDRVRIDFAQAARSVIKELLQDLPSFGAYAQLRAAPLPQSTAALTIAAGKPSVAHVGPLPAPGTTWVYGFADRMYGGRRSEITVRVLRTEGTVIEEAVTTNTQDGKAATRVVEARAPHFLEHSLGGNAALIEIAPYLLAAHDGKGMPRGLQATGYPQGTLGPWVASIEEKGWQRITVSAGSFQALRVEILGRRVVDRQSLRADVEVGRFSIVAWYSPDVRRLVRLEHKTWSATYSNEAQIGHDVVELLSYLPPS